MQQCCQLSPDYNLWPTKCGTLPYTLIPIGKDEIVIRGRDDSFQFYLVGKVLSEERIDGKNFLAKSHLEDEAVEGRWQLKWVSD